MAGILKKVWIIRSKEDAERIINSLQENKTQSQNLLAKITAFSDDEKKAIKDYEELSQKAQQLDLGRIEDILANMSYDERRHYDAINQMTLLIDDHIKEVESDIEKIRKGIQEHDKQGKSSRLFHFLE